MWSRQRPSSGARGALVGISISAFAAIALALLAPSRSAPSSTLDAQAQRFLALALRLCELRPQEIDMYWGSPPDRAAMPRDSTLADLLRQSRTLLAELERRGEDATCVRCAGLRSRVGELVRLLQVIVEPNRYSFEDEARLLYGITLGTVDSDAMGRKRRQLEQLLPGAGSLADRVAAFRRRLIVPPQRRAALFERALAECRARTLAHWKLPADDELEVQWTRGVAAAWHRYDGNGRSTLQVNPDALAYIGSVIDVACHEAYPGHHAQFLLKPAAPAEGSVFPEASIVLLRSPASMLREAAATYAVELAFPPAQRLAFERDVLFPLAGLDPSQAELNLTVHTLLDDLAPSTLPILRDYRDKRLSSDEAIRRLESAALVSSPRSLLDFVDGVGAHVIGYTSGPANVRAYVDARSKGSGTDGWTELKAILLDEKVEALNVAEVPISP